MRINKFLAENGVASRRHADAMVAAGRIKINGQTASLGTDVSDEDEVSIDDKPLERAEKKPEYYLMNKPKGILCTAADDRGRKTVVDLLPAGAGPGISRRAAGLRHRGAFDIDQTTEI